MKRSAPGGNRAAKRQLRAKLTAGERSVRRRLKAAVALNFSGPVLGRANVVYELAERTRAVAHGGMGMVAKLVKALGLAGEIDASLDLLALHKPYYESDHVLNVAYNALCGARTLDDIELRRADQVFLDGNRGGFPARPDHGGGLLPALRRGLGHGPPRGGEPGAAPRVGSPAGFVLLQDGCHRRRRHGRADRCRGQAGHRHWLQRHMGLFGFDGQLRQYCRAAVLGPPRRQPPLHEGVVPLYDRAICLCRQAGFADILLRGDTDFSLTTEFDRWDDDGVRFVFGYNAWAGMVSRAGGCARRALPRTGGPGRARDKDRSAHQARQRERRHRPGPALQGAAPKRPRTWSASPTGRPSASGTTVSSRSGRTCRSSGRRRAVQRVQALLLHHNDWEMSDDQVVAEARKRCTRET